MTVVRYEPTSGADGDALTTTNTPSADSFAYNLVNSGVGVAAVETTVHSIPSATRIFHFSKTTTAGPNYGVFSEPAADTYAFRVWLWFNSLSSGTIQIVRFLTAANVTAMQLAVQSNGKIIVQSPSAGTLWFPNAAQTTNMTTGVLYRWEGYVDNADTTGSLKMRLIRDSDEVVCASTTTLTGLDMAAADVSISRLGASITSGSVSIDIDAIMDVEFGATDYLPAWATAGPPTAVASADGVYQFINAEASAPTLSDTDVEVDSISPSTGTVIGVNEDGDIGVFVPNATQTYTVTIAGVPGGVTADVDVDVEEVRGDTRDTAAPLRPIGLSFPGTDWGE